MMSTISLNMRKKRGMPYFFKNFVKCLLGCLALTNAQLGIIAAFGLCSVFGLPYGPMHTLIMCLNIGLGVDNAFVIGKTMFGAIGGISDCELGD